MSPPQVSPAAASNGPPRLTIFEKLAYACGQAGNVLGESLIATYLLFFYLPPGEGKDAPTPLVPILAFGVIPTMLFVNVVARGVDTFLDPLVANWSDRSTSRLGRRRVFMLIGCLPLSLATAGAFYPPLAMPSDVNVVFLAVVLTVYYAFFSVYVAPYLALLPEIAPGKKENVTLSTMMAAAALVGGLVAINGGGMLIHALGGPTPADNSRAIQHAVALLSTVAFVLLVLPVVVIDERRLVQSSGDVAKSHASFVDSLKSTLSDRAFLPYVLGTTLFAFGFNIVRSALPYFVQVLMNKPVDFPAPIALFASAAIAFPLVGMAAARVGKRPVMVFGTLLLAASLGAFYFVHDVVPGVILLAVGGVGVSVFLAVPNAILSDICNANALRTGERREAMFFGAQGFLQKINLGISTGLLGWLLDLGRSAEHPVGVQLAGPMAAVALVGGAVCYLRYPEQRVLQELAAAPVRTDARNDVPSSSTSSTNGAPT